MKNIRSGCEHGLPEGMTDDGDFFVPQLAVAGSNDPANFGSGLKGSKEIAIDPRCADAFRRLPLGEAKHRLIEGGHVLEGMTVALQVVKVGVERAEDFDGKLERRIGRVQIDEPAWITIW